MNSRSLWLGLIACGTSLAHSQTPATDWTAWYVGLDGGTTSADYRFGSHSDFLTTLPASPFAGASALAPATRTSRHGQFTGGGHLGYVRQYGALVFGAEADWNAATILRSVDYRVPVPVPILVDPAAVYARVSASARWISSARLRAGYAWRNVLLYGTAGPAWSEITASERGTYGVTLSPTLLESAALAAPPFRHRRAVIGWVTGAGLEWSLTPAVSLGLEYRRSDLGRPAFHLGAHPSGNSQITPSPTSVELVADTVTLRVNFRFGR